MIELALIGQAIAIILMALWIVRHEQRHAKATKRWQEIASQQRAARETTKAEAERRGLYLPRAARRARGG